MHIKPSRVRYSQRSISNRFQDGSLIGNLVEDIWDGSLTIEAIPEISVSRINHKWVAADNRRLWVYRHLEKRGFLNTIRVCVIDYIPQRKITAGKSTDFGKFVEVRGNPWDDDSEDEEYYHDSGHQCYWIGPRNNNNNNFYGYGGEVDHMRDAFERFRFF